MLLSEHLHMNILLAGVFLAQAFIFYSKLNFHLESGDDNRIYLIEGV